MKSPKGFWNVQPIAGTVYYLAGTFFAVFMAFGATFPSELHAGPASPPEKPSDSSMVLIPAGKFIAGFSTDLAYRLCLKDHEGQCRKSWFEDEEPIRSIQMDAFYMDKFEITQKEFQQVMKMNPSEIKGPRFPVHSVTWEEARTYCRKLGKRLPTEAEWERAARGGASSYFSWGNRMQSKRANFCDRHCEKRWREKSFDDGFTKLAPVGSFDPNGFGLHDMAGNVYEWVQDWYREDYYQYRPLKNPQGPVNGKHKVMRGGSWLNYSVGIRPADRTDADPEDRMPITGFRCARSL